MPMMSETTPPVQKVEQFTNETPVTPVTTPITTPITTPVTTVGALVEKQPEMQTEKEIIVVPVESKKCKSAELNMTLIRDILILVGLVCFVILMIYVIRRYGNITKDLSASSFSLSFENV